MRFVALILFCIGLIQPAFGQVVQIVKPECGPLQCRVSIATGVIIGRRVGSPYTYYILTVYHVTGNKPRQLVRRGDNYQLSIVTPSGRYPAKILSYNGERLLMLLSIDVPATAPELPVMPIANALPKAGDAVDIHGHSHRRNGGYGVRSVVLRSVSADVFTITSPFEQGESGGPIVLNGQIVGLCEGYFNATKIGFGPSVIAVRDFLGLPPAGGTQGGTNTGQAGVSVSGTVPVPGGSIVSVPGGSIVSVPPPPAPDDRSGDAPRYSPPVHRPGEITPAPVPVDRPRAEPDPISHPIDAAEPIPAKRGDTAGDGVTGPGLGPQITPQGSGPRDSGDAPSLGERLGSAANTGLTLWNILAGAGIVAGTGGAAGLAMFAAGRLFAARRRRTGSDEPRLPYHDDQTLPRHPPVARPVPIVPQEANFIPIPTDYRREAVDWALEQHGRRWPAAIPTVDAIKSLINQRLQSRGYGRDTLHE